MVHIVIGKHNPMFWLVSTDLGVYRDCWWLDQDFLKKGKKIEVSMKKSSKRIPREVMFIV